jgi:hypothetical protein
LNWSGMGGFGHWRFRFGAVNENVNKSCRARI